MERMPPLRSLSHAVGASGDAHDSERCRALLLGLVRDVLAFVQQQQLAQKENAAASIWIDAVQRACQARLQRLQQGAVDVEDMWACGFASVDQATPREVVAEAMVQELLVSVASVRLTDTEEMILEEVENVETLRRLQYALQRDEQSLRRIVRDGAGEDALLRELQGLLRDDFLQALAQNRAQGMAESLHQEASLQFAWETIQDQKQEIVRLRAKNEELSDTLATVNPRDSIHHLQHQLGCHPDSQLRKLHDQVSQLEASLMPRVAHASSRSGLGRTVDSSLDDGSLDSTLVGSRLLPSHLSASTSPADCIQCRRHARSMVELQSEVKQLRAQSVADEDTLVQAKKEQEHLKREHAALASALRTATQTHEQLRQMIAGLTNDKEHLQTLLDTQQRKNATATDSLRAQLAEMEAWRDRTQQARDEDTRRYAVLDEQLSHAKALCVTQMKEKDTAEEKLKEVEKEYDAMKLQWTVDKARAVEAQHALASADRELLEAKQELESARTEIRRHEASCNEVEIRYRQAAADANAMVSKVEALKKTLLEMEAVQQRLQTELAEWKRRGEALSLSTARATTVETQLQQTLAVCRRELHQRQQELAEADGQLNRSEEERSIQAVELKHTMERLQQAETALQSVTLALQQKQQACESLERLLAVAREEASRSLLARSELQQSMDRKERQWEEQRKAFGREDELAQELSETKTTILMWMSKYHAVVNERDSLRVQLAGVEERNAIDLLKSQLKQAQDEVRHLHDVQAASLARQQQQHEASVKSVELEVDRLVLELRQAVSARERAEGEGRDLLVEMGVLQADKNVLQRDVATEKRERRSVEEKLATVQQEYAKLEKTVATARVQSDKRLRQVVQVYVAQQQAAMDALRRTMDDRLRVLNVRVSQVTAMRAKIRRVPTVEVDGSLEVLPRDTRTVCVQTEAEWKPSGKVVEASKAVGGSEGVIATAPSNRGSSPRVLKDDTESRPLPPRKQGTLPTVQGDGGKMDAMLARQLVPDEEVHFKPWQSVRVERSDTTPATSVHEDVLRSHAPVTPTRQQEDRTTGAVHHTGALLSALEDAWTVTCYRLLDRLDCMAERLDDVASKTQLMTRTREQNGRRIGQVSSLFQSRTGEPTLLIESATTEAEEGRLDVIHASAEAATSVLGARAAANLTLVNTMGGHAVPRLGSDGLVWETRRNGTPPTEATDRSNPVNVPAEERPRNLRDAAIQTTRVVTVTSASQTPLQRVEASERSDSTSIHGFTVKSASIQSDHVGSPAVRSDVHHRDSSINTVDAASQRTENRHDPTPQTVSPAVATRPHQFQQGQSQYQTLHRDPSGVQSITRREAACESPPEDTISSLQSTTEWIHERGVSIASPPVQSSDTEPSSLRQRKPHNDSGFPHPKATDLHQLSSTHDDLSVAPRVLSAVIAQQFVLAETRCLAQWRMVEHALYRLDSRLHQTASDAMFVISERTRQARGRPTQASGKLNLQCGYEVHTAHRVHAAGRTVTGRSPSRQNPSDTATPSDIRPIQASQTIPAWEGGGPSTRSIRQRRVSDPGLSDVVVVQFPPVYKRRCRLVTAPLSGAETSEMTVGVRWTRLVLLLLLRRSTGALPSTWIRPTLQARQHQYRVLSRFTALVARLMIHHQRRSLWHILISKMASTKALTSHCTSLSREQRVIIRWKQLLRIVLAKIASTQRIKSLVNCMQSHPDPRTIITKWHTLRRRLEHRQAQRLARQWLLIQLKTTCRRALRDHMRIHFTAWREHVSRSIMQRRLGTTTAIITPPQASPNRHTITAQESASLNVAVRQCVTLLRSCVESKDANRTLPLQHSALSSSWSSSEDIETLVRLLIECCRLVRQWKEATAHKLQEIQLREAQLHRLESHCRELQGIVDNYRRVHGHRQHQRIHEKKELVDVALSVEVTERRHQQWRQLEAERRRLNQGNVAMLEGVIAQLQAAKQERVAMYKRLQGKTHALERMRRLYRWTYTDNMLLRAFYHWRLHTLHHTATTTG